MNKRQGKVTLREVFRINQRLPCSISAGSKEGARVLCSRREIFYHCFQWLVQGSNKRGSILVYFVIDFKFLQSNGFLPSPWKYPEVGVVVSNHLLAGLCCPEKSEVLTAQSQEAVVGAAWFHLLNPWPGLSLLWSLLPTCLWSLFLSCFWLSTDYTKESWVLGLTLPLKLNSHEEDPPFFEPLPSYSRWRAYKCGTPLFSLSLVF